MTPFFERFQRVTYANKIAVNLMQSARMRETVLENPLAFFKRNVLEGDTPEKVAREEYGHETYDWVVYLANGIVDPYHDWPKPYLEFIKYIENKYGSVPAAQGQILHYNNPSYDFVINAETYARYSNADFVDTTLKVTRDDWAPVYAYEYEDELNQERQQIRLIHRTFIPLIEKELNTLYDS